MTSAEGYELDPTALKQVTHGHPGQQVEGGLDDLRARSSHR